MKDIIDVLVTDNSSLKDQSSFFSELEFNNYDDIKIEVSGVGNLSFPLQKNALNKLLEISSPAKFGLKDQTLLDTKIRKTHEISADNLTVKIDEELLQKILDLTKNNLGINKNAKLEAKLHNMLIYQENNFFKTHQDSEKLPGMIASLVITLPSAHIGGDLVIKHNNKTHIFSSENINADSFKSIAFYADCNHKVKKVKQGYRVVLTYNLAIALQENKIQENANPKLTKLLEQYFEDEPLEEAAESKKFIYFLDYDYTEHSLRWDLLKGNDGKNASYFLYAARKLDLNIYLALATQHETWSTDNYSNPYDYDNHMDFLPADLIDGDKSLDFWVDENGNELNYDEYSPESDEICEVEKADNLKPFKTEYEGWMGNYGNTVDYWYRRAAIVLWKKSEQINMDFALNYKSAFENLVSLTLKEGNESEVLNIINKSGENLINKKNYRYGKNDNLNEFLQIAIYIKDKIIAKSILKNFCIVDINENIIDNLVKIYSSYGEPWLFDLFDNWKDNKNKASLKDVYKIVKSLLKFDNISNLVEYFLIYQLGLVTKENHKYLEKTSSRIKKDSVILTIIDFIEACLYAGNKKILTQFLDYLISNPRLYSSLDLANILINLHNTELVENYELFKIVKDYFIPIIESDIAKGVRDKEDMSINVKLSCSCKNCQFTEEFLKDKNSGKFVLSIVTKERQHVTNILNIMCLPLDIFEEKKGSPYKLVIVKNDRLYLDDVRRVNELKNCYNTVTQLINIIQ